MIHHLLTLLCLLSPASAQPGIDHLALLQSPHRAAPSHEDAFLVMTNAAATIEARHSAEDLLLAAKPVHLIPVVFAALDQPVPTPDGFHFSPSSIGMFPGGPNRDVEAQILPVGAQIVYARHRVWNRLLEHAEPAEERVRAIADLFPLAQTDQQKRRLITAGSRNWSPIVEQSLAEWLGDASLHCTLRRDAAFWLAIHTGGKHRENTLNAAWALRGDPCAKSLAGSTIGRSNGAPAYFDARFAVLLVDEFDRALESDHPVMTAATARQLADYLRFTVVPPADARLSVRSDAWRDHVIETTKTWLNEHRERLEADAARAAAGEKPERPPAQPGWKPYDHDHAERIMRENIERAKRRPE